MIESFAVGQRWISHADSSLGLGIITGLDERRVMLHFPAVEEDRVYATQTAPLTRLLLKPGDTVRLADGSTRTVRELSDRGGVAYYDCEDEAGTRRTVCETELDSTVDLTTPFEQLINNQLGKPRDFPLRFTTLTHLASAEGFGLGGLLGPRTSFLSHQLYVAASVGSRFAPRVLLADEVGLGKTIEAGLILNQQILRQRVHRALILTPDSLTYQWLIEMLRRFHLSFSLLDQARLEDTDAETEFALNPLVICPLSVFEQDPALREIALNVDWDLVIIDEAHHLTGLSTPRSEMGEFIHSLCSKSRGLLLLTATPEQAGVEGHFERLQLIDPARYRDFDQFMSEQAQFAHWSDMVDALANDEQPALPEGIDAAAPKASQIRQILDRYGTGRVLFRNRRKAIEGFPVRQRHVYPLPAPELYAHQADHLHPELDHPEAAWLAEDPRVAWLEAHLKSLRPHKVLVICAHQATALALEHHLHMKSGIRSAAFHEALSLIERDRAAAYFAEEIGGAQALICSEIGSEGRNFQFAHHLICFDLPEHPDLLEQRIGRLDRIGGAPTIHIHIPFLEQTAQAVLLRWLDEGLEAFLHSCAVGHQLAQAFRGPLTHAMAHPEQQHDPLIEQTLGRRRQLMEQVEQGRDRLLERNSHDPSLGQQLISQLEKRDEPEQLFEFTELLFDRIGIDQEYQQESVVTLRATENLVTGQLPGLTEDGISATYDRSLALARDDLTFLSWEHPIITESMQAFIASDLGKASIGTFKHKGVPSGTVLLDVIFSIECLAPRFLELGKYLDRTPLRLLLTVDGRNVAAKLPLEWLSANMESVAPGTSATVLARLRSTLESLYPKAEVEAEQVLASRRTHAIDKANSALNEELTRLRHLRALNPSIREDEIAALGAQQVACEEALQGARLSLQGLRVCVAL